MSVERLPESREVSDVEALRTDVRKVVADAVATLSSGDKSLTRAVHAAAVAQARATARPALERFEDRLLEHFAQPSDVQAGRVVPVLRPVVSPEERRLFRYATLHWSIPVSYGYGRRLRFLVEDQRTGKLMGVIGLGDPVYALRDRDDHIGWTADQRRTRLRSVMDAFVLGAVPPYSFLRAGKVVAALAVTREIQDAFWERYGASTSVIAGTLQKHPLALLTTTAAFGRSSMYNRMVLRGTTLWHHVGATAGHGEFLFFGELYNRLRAYVSEHGEPTARSERWGTGWRNRREVVRRAIKLLDLPWSVHVHGLERHIYLAPFSASSMAWLRGEARAPGRAQWSAKYVGREATKRWLLDRSADPEWTSWDRQTLRLWGSE